MQDRRVFDSPRSPRERRDAEPSSIRFSKTAFRQRRWLVPQRRPYSKSVQTPGGADRNRTDDLRLAKPALSQLSYSPKTTNTSFRVMAGVSAKRRSDLVGLGRFELPTSRLSGVRSNQLSYRPLLG